MVQIDTLPAFVLAAIVVLLLPGPTVLLSVLSVAVYALSALAMRGFIAAPTGLRLIQRDGGTALIGAGLIAATNAD